MQCLNRWLISIPSKRTSDSSATLRRAWTICSGRPTLRPLLLSAHYWLPSTAPSAMSSTCKQPYQTSAIRSSLAASCQPASRRDRCARYRVTPRDFPPGFRWCWMRSIRPRDRPSARRPTSYSGRTSWNRYLCANNQKSKRVGEQRERMVFLQEREQALSQVSPDTIDLLQ